LVPERSSDKVWNLLITFYAFLLPFLPYFIGQRWVRDHPVAS
jgi:preprotein translocase subunit Sec63